MPPSRASSVLALVRWKNLLLAALGVLIGGTIALGRPDLPSELAWAALSAIGLGAAGNTANDLSDVEADRVNRPSRPLASGVLATWHALAIGGVLGGFGLFAAWWVGQPLLVIALPAMLVMLVYSPVLKQRGMAGNLAVAVVASLPLVYGASALGLWRAGLVPFALAALLHFAREVVKDLEDIPGDRAMGRRTIPIAWSADAGYRIAAMTLVLFIPATVAPWAAGWYGRRYGIAAVALDAGVALLILRLLARQLDGVRASLKAAMVIGLFALLWDRL